MEKTSKILYISLLLVVLLAAMLRIYPYLMGSLGGEPDSFYHARMSDIFVEEGGVPKYDFLSLQGRPYTYSPIFHASLGTLLLASGFSSLDMVGIYSAVYGTLAVLLIFILARKIFGSNKIALISALALATMGLHLARTSGSSRPDALALVLIVAAFFLLYKRRMLLFAFICSFLALLHPLSCLYFFSFLVLAAIISKVLKNDFPSRQVLLSVILAVLVFILWLLSVPMPLEKYLSKISLESVEMQQNTFLGFLFFLMFSWPFFIAGMLKTKEKVLEKFWFLYSFFFGIFAFRLFFYFAPVASIFAGSGFAYFLGKIGEYKKIFFIISFLLLSISTLFFIYDVKGYPSPQNNSAFLWMRENTPRDSTIASIWDNGHLITKIAERKVLMDGYFEFADRLIERNNAYNDLVSSSNCSGIESLEKKWTIDYLFMPDYAPATRTYKKGILEADGCQFIDAVFDDGAKIIKFKT